MKKKTGGCVKKIGTVFMATLLILDGIFGEMDIQAATLNQLEKNKEQNINREITGVKQSDWHLLSVTEEGALDDMENTDVVTGAGVTTDGNIEVGDKGEVPCASNLPDSVPTPEISAKPMATNAAEPTIFPIVTEEAQVTESPEATAIVTAVPVFTKKPITTQAPIVTKEPEKTKIPIPTATPMITVPGVATGAATTSKPTSSNTDHTSAPVATMAPDGSSVEEVVYCSVHYQLNGGTNAEGNPSKVYASGASYLLKDPKKKGYTFQGWYLESTFKHRVYYVEPNGASSITYYAKWEIVTVQKAKITSAKRLKNGKIRVKVGNVSGVDGYEYVYSLTPTMAKKSLVRSVKNPKDLTKLRKKAKYYIKVRCYKYDSWGRKVYGSYSKVVKCK